MIISQDSRADLIAPDVLIKNTAEEVLSIVKQDKHIVADKKRILALVDAKVLPNFDFERMTQEAAGKNWRIATPEQKNRLVAAFRNLLVNTYTNTFKSYENQTVNVRPLHITEGSNEVTVKSTIDKPGSEPIEVDYEMEKTPVGWKAFDLTVDGVSLIITYRSSFDDLVQQSGMDGLIKSLVEKNAANNAENNSSN